MPVYGVGEVGSQDLGQPLQDIQGGVVAVAVLKLGDVDAARVRCVGKLLLREPGGRAEFFQNDGEGFLWHLGIVALCSQAGNNDTTDRSPN